MYYRQFIEFWSKINKGVLKAFMVPPTGKNIITELAKGQFREGSMFKKGEQIHGLQQILGSYGSVVNKSFKSPYMKAALTWFAAQSTAGSICNGRFCRVAIHAAPKRG